MKPGDYRHHFHAGNVGDVFKHCTLIAMLEEMSKRDRGGKLSVVETHAGAGVYKLGDVGEWRNGLEKLASFIENEEDEHELAKRYLALVRELGVWKNRPLVYPGSPIIDRKLMGKIGKLTCFEIIPEVHKLLSRRMEGDSAVEVILGDGLAALPNLLKSQRAGENTLIHMDPAYSNKGEWTSAANALVAAAKAAPKSCFALWYPIISLTRPRTLIKQIQEAGISGTALELITTSLSLKKKRLNGSGVLLINAPNKTKERLLAAAPSLGEGCAATPNQWSLNLISW